MKKIKVVTHYSKDDVDFMEDYYSIDVYMEGNKVISYGDSYHDKGSYKLNGFLDCLDCLSIPYEIEYEYIADCDY